ncbi:ROK family protein [Vagococcus allomyrinae]|uniref:ROK family protein n=1 Tax=Vagococcus allomyrinae TaxID=2794353 RepID=UPI001FD815DC|nr:ROK family protein [Vagococcus allomyrinae]
MTLLALDIGGSAVKHAIWHKDNLIEKDSFPTPLTRKSFYEAINELINNYRGKYHFSGVALSCPGDTDETTGMVNGISYVPFLHLGEFQQEFSEAVSLPVTMFNDANSAALAEMTMGIGVGHQEAVFLIIGSGVGLAVVHNGKIAMETSEKIDQLDKLVADGVKAFNNSKVSPVHIARRVSLKKLKMPSAIDGKDVFQLANDGDPIATKEVMSMYSSLAEIVISINGAFKPELIGIGGGISNNQELLPNLKKAVTNLLEKESGLLSIFKTLFNNQEDLPQPNIQLCQFKNDANLLGAIIHFNETKDLP